MFIGLSAFAPTPLAEAAVDEPAYGRLIARLARAGVDSIGALGSTGSYAYLDRAERARAVAVAVRHAGEVPVIAGVGALRMRDILHHVEDAQEAGASAVILAPMTYEALSDDEVFALYEEVCANLSVPLAIYDNPVATRVTFSDELHSRVAQLRPVAAIKLPLPAVGVEALAARVTRLRALVPATVAIGVSGDDAAAAGLSAGCDLWFSVLGGTLPIECLALVRAAQRGAADDAAATSARLQPIWQLFARYGTYRVVAALTEQLGLVPRMHLPRPVRSLDADGMRSVAEALTAANIRL
ncbi:dihydrodipicolinate synthase family protein [Okibacterium fritillariae]|uniref:dihydrodipicolinate synthase family protein n=1 Tax=Okibacterium fritillariae TaxID=123320 RepID=UPI004055447F